ncbi:hypothetical protein D3C86_1943410 [compost metagenome]
MVSFKAELERSLVDKKNAMQAFREGKFDLEELKVYKEMKVDLIHIQRHELHLLKKDRNYDDDILREEEKRLDLEELSGNGKLF